MVIEVQCGDMMAVHTPRLGGWFIRLKDRIQSADSEASYNHILIVANRRGATFESKFPRIGAYHLDNYVGKRVLLFRPRGERWRKIKALRELRREHDGQPYPVWRIGLHAVSRPLAKYIRLLGIPVCSEIGRKFCWLIGIADHHYMGWTPDMVVDLARVGRDYEILYEGIWPPGGKIDGD